MLKRAPTDFNVSRRCIVGVAAALFGLSILACGCGPKRPWTMQPSARMRSPIIAESSGVISSRRFPDVLWTHNDGDNSPLLFAVDRQGYLLASFEVPDSVNIDWEDIAFDGGSLFIMDNTSRTDPDGYTNVYVFSEPDPFLDQTIERSEKRQFLFPEGEGPFDCEAMMVHDGRIFIVTKSWDGLFPRIYSGPVAGGRLEFHGVVPISAMVTGGDVSEDGKRVVLASYRALMVFEGEGDPATLMTQPPLVCSLNARQVEAVAWKGESLVLTNEQREIYEVPSAKWRKHTAPFLRPPERGVPYIPARPSVGLSLKRWPKGEWLKLPFRGQEAPMGRLAWSPEGLHIGLEIPPQVSLRSLQPRLQDDFDQWFLPGLLYLLINPVGDRPLSFGSDDRCLVLTREDHGHITVRSLFLRPATLITSTEKAPSWVRVEEAGNRLVITLAADTPGLGALRGDRKIGFNLLLVADDGKLASWVPLTRPYSWDQPNVWGLLELDQ